MATVHMVDLDRGVRQKILTRAAGRCECTHSGHRHGWRCHERISASLYGHLDRAGGWELRSRLTTSADPVDQYEAVCGTCVSKMATRVY